MINGIEKVYVSGPMSGLKDDNFPAFNSAEVRLRAAGFDVENPAQKGIIEGWTWEDYLRYDIRVLMDCQAIYLLNGWRRSQGASLEMHIAAKLKFSLVADSHNIRTQPRDFGLEIVRFAGSVVNA